MIAKLIAAALAGTAFASGASALTESFVAGIPFTTPDYHRTVALPQFDPALGTLTGVAAGVYGTISGSGYLEVLYDNRSARSAGNAAVVDLTVPDIATFGIDIAWSGPTVVVGPFDGIRDMSGPDTVYGSGFDGAVDARNATAFAGYIGTGTFSATIDVAGVLPQGYSTVYNPLTGTPTYGIFTADQVLAGATVTYTYSARATGAVPEPSSWALLIVGFGLTGLIARWRTRSVSA